MGQFDDLLAAALKKQQGEVSASLRENMKSEEGNELSTAPLEGPTGSKFAQIPSADRKPGLVIYDDHSTDEDVDAKNGNPTRVSDADTGTKATGIQARIRKAVTGRTAGESAAVSAANRDSRRAAFAADRAGKKIAERTTRAAQVKESARQSAGLASTTMRLDESTGTAYSIDPSHEDYREPVKTARPDAVIAGRADTVNDSARPEGFAASGQFLSSGHAARAMDPGKKNRERSAKRATKQEAKRQSYLAGEEEFNSKQEASGSTLRSRNGVTYDLADREAEAQHARDTAVAHRFGVPAKDRSGRPEYDRGEDRDVEYKFNGQTYTKKVATYTPRKTSVTEMEEVNPSTFDADLKEAAYKNDVIPASTIKKPASDGSAGTDDYRPSSIVPTAPHLENLGTSADSNDEDNPKGDTYKGAAEENLTDVPEPESEEQKSDKAEETAGGYRPSKTKKEELADAADRNLQTGAREYEQSEKKKNAKGGSKKSTRLDAFSKPVPETEDRGPNFKTEYEELPEPIKVTEQAPNTIGMDESTGIGSAPQVYEAAAEERSRRADTASDILDATKAAEKNKTELDPNIGKQLQKTMVERTITKVPVVPADNGKPSGPIGPKIQNRFGGEQFSPSEPATIPDRLFQSVDAPASAATNYNEVERAASGESLTEDQRFREADKDKGPIIGTHTLDSSRAPTPATPGRTDFQQSADEDRRVAFMGKFGVDAKEDTRHSTKVMDTAKDLAIREGTIKSMDDIENPSPAVKAGMRKHIAKAYVLHNTGGASDEAEENLDRVTGSPRGSAAHQRSIDTMYEKLKGEELFNRTKVPGKGVTYSMDGTGQNAIDPDKAHFRASNGSLVKFSEINHPEHPLPGGKGTLEGSAVPFRGGVPAADGTMNAYEGHEGWHPNKIRDRDGNRITVFEKNHVPENAKHEAQAIRETVAGGSSFTQTRKDIESGKETALTGPGKTTVKAAKPGRITGVKSRRKHADIANEIAGQLSQQGVGVAADKPAASTSYVAPVPNSEEPASIVREEPTIPSGTSQRSGEARSGVINVGQSDQRLPSPAENEFGTKMRQLGVKGNRKISKEARSKEKAGKTPLLTPGSFVMHKGEVGKVVSHNATPAFGEGHTTAVVNFGNEMAPDTQTFTGSAVHVDSASENKILKTYTPATTATSVTHEKHGAGTLLGTTGDGDAHVDFGSKGKKTVPYEDIKTETGKSEE